MPRSVTVQIVKVRTVDNVNKLNNSKIYNTDIHCISCFFRLAKTITYSSCWARVTIWIII